MAGLTRKELLAGAAAAGVVAGCGGSPNGYLREHEPALVRRVVAAGARYLGVQESDLRSGSARWRRA